MYRAACLQKEPTYITRVCFPVHHKTLSKCFMHMSYTSIVVVVVVVVVVQVHSLTTCIALVSTQLSMRIKPTTRNV